MGDQERSNPASAYVAGGKQDTDFPARCQKAEKKSVDTMLWSLHMSVVCGQPLRSVEDAEAVWVDDG